MSTNPMRRLINNECILLISTVCVPKFTLIWHESRIFEFKGMQALNSINFIAPYTTNRTILSQEKSFQPLLVGNVFWKIVKNVPVEENQLMNTNKHKPSLSQHCELLLLVGTGCASLQQAWTMLPARRRLTYFSTVVCGLHSVISSRAT